MPKAWQVEGLSSTDSLASNAQRVVATKLAQTLSFLGAVRKDEDIEAVHDMRIACKRLRESLRVLQPCFKKRQFNEALAQVDALNDALGAVRDADVLRDYLGKAAPDGRPPIGVQELISRVATRRDEAYRQLIPILDAWEAEEGRRAVEALAQGGRAVRRRGARNGVNPSKSVPWNAPGMVWRRLQKLGPLLRSEVALDDVAALHRMRIRIKRLRYTMEILAPCYGRAFARCLRTVENLQELLGKIHDCDVRMGEVNAALADIPRPRQAGLRPLVRRTQAERARLCEELSAVLTPPSGRGLARRTARAMKLSKKEARAWVL